MSQSDLNILLLSDFNTENLAAFLKNDKAWPVLDVSQVNFSGWTGALAGAAHPTLVWTLPENAVPSYKALVSGKDVKLDVILKEVDDFSALITRTPKKCPLLLVTAWTTSFKDKRFELMNSQPESGQSYVLWRMNVRLAENLSKDARVHVLDPLNWILDSRRAFQPKLGLMTKVPFGNDVFEQAALSVKSSLRGLYGRSRKLLVVDLDDCLWGGLVGEDGWENLVLGGHDPAGEAFQEFQRMIKAVSRRGVLLAIVSKNDEKRALEAIEKHPEMVLKLNDFAGRKINWKDKSANILELTRELNIGQDSVVFIDDSVVEREAVKKLLPDVYVPDWPEDKMLYPSAFTALDCFNRSTLTEEDRARTELYHSEKKRTDSKSGASSTEDWLKSLDTQVSVELLSASNLPRAAQLFNKTNQMNLSTRRLSESELSSWVAQGKRKFLTFRVKDAFGDSGLTGLASLEWNGKEARIVDFILSCRVIGRGVEESMLHVLAECAKEGSVDKLIAHYAPTPKNGPCLDFLKRSGLRNEKDQFLWDGNKPYPKPPFIRIEGAWK